MRSKSASGKPPRTTLLIGAGLAGFLVIAMGVWFIIRDKDGKEIARVKAPDGASVTMQTEPPDQTPNDAPIPAGDPKHVPNDPKLGWQSLFEGNSMAGWRGSGGGEVPSDWKIEGDAIVAPGGKSSIATVAEYGDFELEFEWKVSSGANGGVFYGWHGKTVPSGTDGMLVVAPEFQLIDNIGHPNGKNAETSAGSVFGLYAPSNDTTKPVGQWNQARLAVRGADVEHWLNGVQVVSYTRGSTDWKQRVTKHELFSDEPEFSQIGPGRIVLQSNVGTVWYRQIRLRPLNNNPLQVDGSPSAADSAKALLLVDSPLDDLDPAAIPAEERFEWQPQELVAVIGSHARRHWEEPVAAAISPDGKLAATLAMSRGTFATDNLIVWDLATQTVKWRLGMQCYDQGYLWFTPDSQRLVVLPRREHIHVYTLKSPEPDVQRLNLPGITNPETHHLGAILEQGHTLAIPVQGSNQFRLHTADWKRGEITQAVSTSPQAQTKTRFLFADDANQAVYVSMEGKLRRVTIRDAQWEQDEELAIPLAAGEKLSAVAPDGKRLTIQTATEFQIWHIAGATPQKHGVVAAPSTYSSQFSPDGRWLTIKYTGVELYRIDGAKPQRITAVSSHWHGAAHARIAFSADGNQAVCTDGANFVRFWNLSAAEPLELSAWDPNRAFSTLFWRPTLHPDNGRLLLKRFGGAGRYNNRYQLWNLSGRTPVPSPDAQTFLDVGRVAGRILPAGSDTYVAQTWLWDGPGTELYRFDGKAWKQSGSPFGPTNAVGDTSRDGRSLVMMESGQPSELHGWDLTTNPPTQKWKLPIGPRESGGGYNSTHQGRCLTIADNQQVLAAYVPAEAGKDPTKHELLLVHHLDAQPEITAKIPVSMAGREHGDYAFALSRDGRLLAHSRDRQNELILEDISGPQPRQLQSMKVWLYGHFRWVSFSPDGRHLACATDENVIVLEVANFKTVWKWDAPGDIVWIEWAADGRHLVTLNSNHTAYVLRLNQLTPDVPNVAPPEPAMPLSVDPERHVAEWVLAHGGSLSLSNRRSVQTAAELPEGPFFITNITLANVNTEITPEEWRSLGELRLVHIMNLAGSGVTDEALEAIAHCSTLDYLVLANNPKIADIGLKHLAALSRLETLDLGGCSMTADGLAHLGKLTRLRMLKIQFTKKLLNITTLAPLLTLQALEYLELNYTTPSDAAVAELQALPRLRYLNLHDSQITSTAIDSLAAFPNLRGVILDGNKLSADALRRLAESPTLAVVSVTGCGLTPDEYLEVARALPRITLVHPTLREHYAADIAAADWIAGVGNISGGYVPYLKKEFFIPLFQTDVRLTQANVPAEEMRRFAALKNVTSLAIDAPGFTEEQVRTALESLREYPTLELFRATKLPSMQATVLQELSRHTGLSSLTLQGDSNVTDKMLEVLPSLVHLHTLNIDSNLLTGQIWPLVGKLPDLRELSFYTSSQLTCEGLGELRSWGYCLYPGLKWRTPTLSRWATCLN